MFIKHLQKKYATYLGAAGIEINGKNPYDIQIHDPRTYTKVLLRGTLGLGESYMDGLWDCERLDEMFTRLITHIKKTNQLRIMPADITDYIRPLLFNLQKITSAYYVGERHYDIGNHLFERMLDSHMNYSCGYWKNADTLEDAQRAKMDLIGRKLFLKKGMRVLDIGCGWGGIAKYIAKNYGVSVVGVTISKQQANYAQQNCQGLPIEIRLQDYRLITGKFDRIYSVGMFEHVGVKNYRVYMKKVQQLLVDDGLFFVTHYRSFKFSTQDRLMDREIYISKLYATLV